MIIDSHAHVAPGAGQLGARQDASEEAFLRALDDSPIDVVVLLPIEPFIPTEFVFSVAGKRPGRVECYGSVDPKRGFRSVEDFERLAHERPIRGLKLHPRRQGIGFGELPVLRALVEKSTDLELPVLIDCFPYGKGALRDDSLELIATLAERVPAARLIIAHMGGIRLLEALIVARTSYSIFLDLSLVYSVYRNSHLEADIFYAIRRIGADRCLYGSDYPDVALDRAYREMREALDRHGFSDDDRERVFGRNAAELLQITKGGAT
jgi:predicted TIM-barrel fold metal-dependent hydrolase